MPKTVHPNNQALAHAWAHANPKDGYGRTSSASVYYNNGTIYSYGPHFPIASIIELDNLKYVVWSKDSYSVTTSKHQSYARSAVSHITNRLYVREGMQHGDYENRTQLKTFLSREFERVQKYAEDELLKISRKGTRETTKVKILQSIDTEYRYLKEFAKFCERLHKTLPYTPYQSRPDDDKRHDKEFKQLLRKIVTLQIPEDYQTAIAQNQAIIEAEQKRKQRQFEADKKEFYAKTLPEWRNCEQGYLNNRFDNYSYLRIREYYVPLSEGQTPIKIVETSKGITFTIAEAKALITAFKRGKLLGMRHQNYTITQVNTDVKTIVSGCHTIPFDEVVAIDAALKALESN